jgi:hypothetical protein
MNFGHRIILVQAGVLVQCSVDRSIAMERVTTWVLVSQKKERGLHFYSSSVGSYRGDRSSMREREREKDKSAPPGHRSGPPSVGSCVAVLLVWYTASYSESPVDISLVVHGGSCESAPTVQP